MSSTDRTTARKSLWIPRLFIGGGILVFTVNAVMIWLAVTTFTGRDRDDTYARSIGYNSVLAAQRNHDELGWETAVTAAPDRLAVVAADGEARPLAGATVTAMVKRPVDSHLDFDAMLQAADPGRYVALVDWPAKGQWDVLITIEHDGRRFQQQERVFVR